jgi:hypothetical protein
MPATGAPASLALTTVSQTLYANAAADAKRRTVQAIFTNLTGAAGADHTATLSWTDASAGNAATALVVAGKVEKQNILIGPVKVLEPGDTLTALASAVGVVVASINILNEEPNA